MIIFRGMPHLSASYLSGSGTKVADFVATQSFAIGVITGQIRLIRIQLIRSSDLIRSF